MDLKEFLFLIRKKRQTIALMVILAILLVSGVSLLFPLRYEAKSRLLISQETGNADAYTVSRSNEYLGNLFAEVSRSASFFDLTMSSSYNIDENYFSGNYASKIKKWRNTVQSRTIADSGIIEISVYHTSPLQAQQLALAVNEVMMSNNINYQGNGDRVKINVIDQPLVSNYPTKPDILQNSILALIFGGIFSLFYIYIFPEERYDWRLFGNDKRRRHQQKMEIANNAVWQYLPAQNRPAAPETDPLTAHYNQEPGAMRGNISNIMK